MSNLDEDNYLAPDHIGSLVTLLVEKQLDWGYSLRTLAMLGAPHTFSPQQPAPRPPPPPPPPPGGAPPPPPRTAEHW